MKQRQQAGRDVNLLVRMAPGAPDPARALRETVRETYESAVQDPLPPPPERLTAEQESRVLAEWHQR